MDIHHIALGVAFVGCIVTFFLIKTQQSIQEQSRVLAAYSYVPSAHPTCIPIPHGFKTASLSASEKRYIMERFCLPRITPIVQPSIPAGCYYKRVCLMIACPAQGKCENCRSTLFCPNTTPRPTITCTPQPTCASGSVCPETEIHSRFCLQTSTTVSGSPSASGGVHSTTGNSLTSMWNTFLRKLTNR